MKNKKDFYTKKGFVINVDVFKVDVVFCVNMSASEITTYLKKVCHPKFVEALDPEEYADWEEDGRTEGRMIRVGGGFVVLLYAKNDHFRRYVGTLAHEVTHVVQYLLRERRIPLIEDTEEVHAYLTEYLLTEALYSSY